MKPPPRTLARKSGVAASRYKYFLPLVDATAADFVNTPDKSDYRNHAESGIGT
jgi:hypothetical protein